MSDSIRRTMPLFPIGIVMQLTELSARQIRYYEENELVSPARTEGNRRMFSFNDVDRLLEIKSLIEQRINMAGIKEIFNRKYISEQDKNEPVEEVKNNLSEKELRRILRNELTHPGRHSRASLRQGDMSRFFH